MDSTPSVTSIGFIAPCATPAADTCGSPRGPKFRKALVTATILMLPLAAHAQPINGLYIGASAGVKIVQNENTSLTAAGTTGTGRLETGVGPAASLSLGYGLGHGFRAELEGDFRSSSFSVSGGKTTVSGTEHKYGPMVNVVYDVVGVIPLVQPYIGAGIGYQWARESNLRISTPHTSFGATPATEGDFAYQAIVGAAIPIAAVPGLSVTADYRYMGLIGDRTYNGSMTIGRTTVPATVKLDGDSSHAFLVGFRYAFGGPPAPAHATP